MAWDQPVLLAILNAHPDHHERVSCLISRFVDISHLIDVFDILLMEVFHKADLVSGRVQKALRNPVGLSLESLNLDAGTEVDWLTLRATLSAAVLPKATQLQRVTLWILGVSSLLSTGLYFISSIKHYLSGVDRRWLYRFDPEGYARPNADLVLPCFALVYAIGEFSFVLMMILIPSFSHTIQWFTILISVLILIENRVWAGLTESQFLHSRHATL